MEYQHKLLLVALILVIAAVYITMSLTPQPAPDSSKAEALLAKMIFFGKGATDYTYTYNEVSDGYTNIYIVTKNSGNGTVMLQNPLSTKKAYFLENETILCIDYQNQEACSQVDGNSDVKNYIDFMKSKFFNDNVISKNKDDLDYLIANKYLKLSPTLSDMVVNGATCKELSYQLDMSNISLSDAARFGVSSNAPKVFDWKMCISEDGTPYEKAFNYSIEGQQHQYTLTITSFKPSSVQISAPENLTSIDELLGVLSDERNQQVKLATCFTTLQGENRDRCISTMALDLKRKDLCGLSGSRRDSWLLSLAPITKDTSLCIQIASATYQDDCYIEMAGAYKNATYCSSIKNASKMGECSDASKPLVPNPPGNITNGTTPGNQTENTDNATTKTSNVNPQDLLNYIENAGNSTK